MSQEITPERKMDKKVIALAIICIILAASLVGIIAVYQPTDNSDLQAQLAAKNATISSLQTQIANLQSQLANSQSASSYTEQISYLNQQIAALNSSLVSANSDLEGYLQLVYLQLSGTLYSDNFTQDANATTTVSSDQLLYSGFILVVAEATANTTYAECLYTFGDYNFDYNVTLGTSGTAMFPVVGTPSEPVTVGILIGNINQETTNSVNATITYYY
jgi:hypothetical protein